MNATPDTAAAKRERLILEHLPQVRRIAWQIRPDGVGLEDLISVGILGLIAAIDRFEEKQGAKLRTYAEYKIRGAMLDSIREMDWGSRYRRRIAKQIGEAVNAVSQRLQCAPTEEEIAAELGVCLAEYRRLVVEIEGLKLEIVDGAKLETIAPAAGVLPSASLEKRELDRVMAEAILTIPPIEATVLELYYGEELTLKQVGERLGMPWARVGGVKSRALARLRVQVRAQWPLRGEASITCASAGAGSR